MSLSVPTMAAIRFGYGLRPGEASVQNKDALLAQLPAALQSPVAFPVGGLDERRAAISDLQQQLRDLRQSEDDDQERREHRKLLQRQAQARFQQDANARLLQAVLSPYGFHERLATFWTNHFSTSANKSLPMRLLVPAYEAEAIRPHIAGHFSDLLRSATEHPAMLIYLDQAQSLGPDSRGGMQQKKGLNENLGRELLELHTLGAGSGYTQADVRAAAMVLTGLTIDRRDMDAMFRPGISEPGPHKVLGISYGGPKRTERDYLSLLDELAANPKTALHICRKLVVHFISDDPPDGMISVMTDAWRKTDGNLTAVYTAMLAHPAAWDNPGSKARQPFDYVVAGLRALNAGPDDGNVGRFLKANQGSREDLGMAAKNGDASSPNVGGDATMMGEAGKALRDRKAIQTARALGQGALRRMGQPTWLPPSPAGFEESFGAWITASQLAERLRWARRATAQFGQGFDPREFLKATLADAARDDTIRIVGQAPNKISGLMLTLASPEFNRR
ncbi:hypothetical protein ASE04_24770 [Rhizobium sp. Root708]|uniref:DUF1800 domain-containing protein n=1 Tax=Rhizobium sp. Root708 TaxID=1736592 RepID=UPI0006FE0511|nr:DUF1800 domain-containing protein [Rhizobium sp. Root708]KRB60286.1 hypothetical protein ASE04_24770 [Rhizobium sp. Root708]